MKRAISLVLALATALMLAVPVSAAEFSDLPKDSKFYDFLHDLVDRGIFTGYSDGTIRPTVKTTTAQALTLFSRFFDLSDTDKSYIYEDYEAQVNALVPSSTAKTYRNALAVCLAANVVRQSELRSVAASFSQPITREKFALYLVRTLGLEETAHAREYTSLTFTDTEDISSDALFEIDLLVRLGIIGGYDDNTFRPNGTSTRQVVAKFLSLAFDYVEERGLSLTIDGYHNTARFTGVLAAYDNESLTVTGTDGVARRFTRTGAEKITVNGVSASLAQLYVGCGVSVSAQGNALSAAAITYDTKTDYIQGKIAYLSIAAATGEYIAVQQDGGTTVACTVASSTVYTGAKNYNELKEGQFVTVERTDGIAARVYVSDGEKTVTGTVSALNYTVSAGTLLVTDSAGTLWSFPVSYDSLPETVSGGVTISFNALKSGDRVTLSIDGAALKRVTREAAISEYSGTLSFIGQYSSRTEWTLKLDDGTTATFSLSAAASYANGSGHTLESSAIGLGDSVTVTVADSVITKVIRTAQASSQPSASASVTGTVLHVDTAKKTILALVDGSPLELDVSKAKIQNTTGSTVSLSSIASGQAFLAYGAYTDTAAFSATLLILT